MLDFQEHPPSPELRAFIQCYWTAVFNPHKDWDPCVPILPDGYLDVSFVFSGGVQRFDRLKAVFEYPASIWGVQTEPLLFKPMEGLKVLAIRFRPGGAFSLLQQDVKEFTNTIVSLQEFSHPFLRQLQSKLFDLSDDLLLALRCLDQELKIYLLKNASLSQPFTQAVHRMIQTKGQITIEELCQQLGFSRQYLQQLFQKQVGLSPKYFCRMTRFHALVQAIPTSFETNWSHLALEQGYYDQSHLIADFKTFSGMTPNEFWKIFHSAQLKRNQKLEVSF